MNKLSVSIRRKMQMQESKLVSNQERVNDFVYFTYTNIFREFKELINT